MRPHQAVVDMRCRTPVQTRRSGHATRSPSCNRQQAAKSDGGRPGSLPGNRHSVMSEILRLAPGGTASPDFGLLFLIQATISRRIGAPSIGSKTLAKTRIHLIAAARPNFMKVAPLYHALAATDWAEPVLVHTGQHYDRNMSDAILEDLGIPNPDHHLGVGSGSHAEQTGGVMIAYEKLCQRRSARLHRRGRRRQFDGRVRHGRRQALDPGGASRGWPCAVAIATCPKK